MADLHSDQIERPVVARCVTCSIGVAMRCPGTVLALVSVLSVTSLLVPPFLVAMPDFSDPQAGFETRGTSLAARIRTWINLSDSTNFDGPLTVDPESFRRSRRSFAQSLHTQANLNTSRQVLNSDESSMFEPKESFVQTHFCGPPDDIYARVILESDKGQDLFVLESLRSACNLERQLISTNHYQDICVQTSENPGQCCKPWSLANYVAALNNRPSCQNLTEQDVEQTKLLIRRCSRYFHEQLLGPDCHESGHCQAPIACVRHNAVFEILNFMVEASFSNVQVNGDDTLATHVPLKRSAIFLPVTRSIAAVPYYHEIEKLNLHHQGVSIVGMDFGIKRQLFNEHIVNDTWLMGLGSLFVLACVWLYTKSFFLTLMTMVSTLFSLGIAYFFYTVVLGIDFFPFINLLVIVVIIGIGADDVFVFCEVWNKSEKASENGSKIAATNTLQSAFVSIMGTSATTSGAFLASSIHSITAVRCFSIFSAATITFHCMLMILWIPACQTLLKRWCSSLMPTPTRDRFRFNVGKKLANAVVRFRHWWIIIFTTFGLFSAFVVFFYPKLQLPNSPELQLFRSTHYMEMYDSLYRNMFWFGKSNRMSESEYGLPLRFVWGVSPVDNGDYMDPRSLGRLDYDLEFDISTEESQQWFLNFCRQLRKLPFYKSTSGPLLSNCFIESFVRWMKRRCIDPIDRVDYTPCCETSLFPYNVSTFTFCISQATSELFKTPSEYFNSGFAGPKFSKDPIPIIKAVVIEYDSTLSYSASYEDTDAFYKSVESWLQRLLKIAPIGMKNGWFVSDLEFYDLQKVLSESTLLSIYISIGLALFVLLTVTSNVIISLYAFTSIVASILSIVAVLVLLGWQLNILESVAILTAIGLSVDFSLHYAVCYSFSSHRKDRLTMVRFSLNAVLAPVTMAALTTGGAGAFMMPSSVLPYIRLGVLLITVTSISWLYSTFYLCSLLAVIGPQNRFGYFCIIPAFLRLGNSSTNTEKEIQIQLEPLTN